MKDCCSVKGCVDKVGLDEHHYIPKSLADTSKNTGCVVTLCKTHHEIIHKQITAWMFWGWVVKEDRDKCRKFIEEKTKKWVMNIAN